MNHHDNLSQHFEDSDCIAKGICSISPALSATHAVILSYLKLLVFYLIKLDALGARSEQIKNDYLEIFSGLIKNIEYTQENINNVINVLYDDLHQAKKLYSTLCQERNISPEYLKPLIKLSKQSTITDVIRQGHKYLEKRTETINIRQEKLLDLLLIVLKSICLHIVELQGLNVNIDNHFTDWLFAFGFVEQDILSKNLPDSEVKEQIENLIKKYVKLDYELMQKVYDARKTEFGDFICTKVSLSPRPGKAILVAGANMKELELILEATKDKGIDIYTHGQMITGHSFEKLKAYPNLVGHYGQGMEYAISDFSNFPGAVFLTRLSLHRIENLFRGRVFTSDKVTFPGIIRIKEGDFEPIIQSALSANGFTQQLPEKFVEVGFVEKEFIEKINEIVDKIKKNKIKHIFAIGVSNKTDTQKKYFQDFLELLNDDCFAFSFSYTNNKENVMLLNIDYGFPIAYKAIDILSQTINIRDLNLTVMFTRCEPHTIPNILNMKYMGIKNIYFGGCSAHLINPALVDLLIEKLNLKNYTNPTTDFNAIINEDNNPH